MLYTVDRGGNPHRLRLHSRWQDSTQHCSASGHASLVIAAHERQEFGSVQPLHTRHLTAAITWTSKGRMPDECRSCTPGGKRPMRRPPCSSASGRRRSRTARRSREPIEPRWSSGAHLVKAPRASPPGCAQQSKRDGGAGKVVDRLARSGYRTVNCAMVRPEALMLALW